MNIQDIQAILSGIIHPEKNKDIISLGMVDKISVNDEKIQFTLNFQKAKDPFINSLKKASEFAIRNKYPEFKGDIVILITEAAPKKVEKPEQTTTTGGIKNIIAISSGKGGVGKSTVTSNLAVAFAEKGLKTAILDADIYGPSIPKMFGLESYKPLAERTEGRREVILPAETNGIKIMSIGFFIDPEDALVWRGAMATNALRQLIHQTEWGEIDVLLIDMPPGTGDIHLTIVHELKLTGAVIVTTPQEIALADVVRGIKMFQSEGIGVPVLGIAENMSWFTPAELPDNKYYIFGRNGGKDLAEKAGLQLLAQIPLVQSVSENSDNGTPESSVYTAALADSIISRL
ncbi:MAG: Mrp/NBP35 family ATP-binding protein [Rikenellaceae bacterium]|nr:Mrp/NBP35 family ATP-binding protein [Rikenellaceae bacterium]